MELVLILSLGVGDELPESLVFLFLDGGFILAPGSLNKVLDFSVD